MFGCFGLSRDRFGSVSSLSAGCFRLGFFHLLGSGVGCWLGCRFPFGRTWTTSFSLGRSSGTIIDWKLSGSLRILPGLLGTGGFGFFCWERLGFFGLFQLQFFLLDLGILAIGFGWWLSGRLVWWLGYGLPFRRAAIFVTLELQYWHTQGSNSLNWLNQGSNGMKPN